MRAQKGAEKARRLTGQRKQKRLRVGGLKVVYEKDKARRVGDQIS